MPASQLVQADAAAADWYLPASQRVQTDAAAAEYVPAVQSVQEEPAIYVHTLSHTTLCKFLYLYTSR